MKQVADYIDENAIERSEDDAKKIAVVSDNTNRSLPFLAIGGIKEMVGHVESVIKDIMVVEQDYGNIPGVEKKILFLPGAQKLGMAFQLKPEYKIIVYRSALHIQYDITCVLSSRQTGVVIGEGVGSCSTYESKYRYRWDYTDTPVPSEYWDTRDKSLLGEGDVKPVKGKKGWVIAKRIENPDIADIYNTVLKMAKKRAYVDAIQMATSCAHIFTQDLEDMDKEDYRQDAASEVSSNNVGASADSKATRENPYITNPQRKMLFAKASECGISKGIITTWLESNGFVNGDGDPSTSALTNDGLSNLLSFMAKCGIDNADHSN